MGMAPHRLMITPMATCDDIRLRATALQTWAMTPTWWHLVITRNEAVFVAKPSRPVISSAGHMDGCARGATCRWSISGASRGRISAHQASDECGGIEPLQVEEDRRGGHPAKRDGADVVQALDHVQLPRGEGVIPLRGVSRRRISAVHLAHISSDGARAPCACSAAAV